MRDARSGSAGDSVGRVKCGVAALLVSIGLSGCVSDGLTAVADGVDGVGTLVVGAPTGAPRPVQIFVASTRPPERAGAARRRAPCRAAPTFSLTTVSVPPEHEAG